MRLNAFCFVLTFIVSGVIKSQVTPVVVRNHPDNTASRTIVEIKWALRKIVAENGSNIYRRAVGEDSWLKLNELPLVKADSLSPDLAQRLPEAVDFFRIAEEVAKRDADEIGFMLINLYGLIFLYNDFAESLGIYFRDASAEVGTTYEYRVTEITASSEKEIGISKPIVAGSYQKEDPVTDFTVKQVKKVVELDWNVDDNRFISYNIYYNIQDSIQNVQLNNNPLVPTLIRDTETGKEVYPSPQFRFSRMSEGYVYAFRIEGIDLFGAASILSDTVTFLFNDVTPPLPATGFTGVVDSMKVFLNWVPSISEDVKEHVLYRSTKSDTLYEAIQSFKMERAYIDQLNIPGPYFYYLTTLDYAGNENKSKIVYINAGDIDPPAKPQGLTIASDTGRLVLSWQANTEPDLAGYHIFRTVNDNNDTHYMLLNSEPYDSTVFVQHLPKVVKNKFYYFIVAADTSYNRSERSDYAIGQMPDILPPEQPFIKKITYEEGQIVVEWIQNVEKDLIGYHIYRSDSTSTLHYERVNATLINPSVATFTDQSSEPNQGYLYYLEALDSAGNASFPSLPAYAFRKEEIKQDLDLLKVSVKYHKRKKSNVIRWQPIEGEALLGYVVFKAEENEKLKPMTGLSKAIYFTDKIEDSARLISYQVRAYMNTGEQVVSEVMNIKNKSKDDD